MPRWGTWRALLAGALAVAGTAGSVAPVHAARLDVAIVGDSVSEGLHLPNAVEEAPAGALRTVLERRGLRATATGFLPANPHPQFYVFEREWEFEGYRFGERSMDGASGYTAVGKPGAVATANVVGDRVAVLYTRHPGGATFPVVVDGIRHELDGHAAEPTVAKTWIPLRRGRAKVEVWGPPTGTIRFTGLLAESADDDVAVLGLGHGGRQAQFDTGPRNVAALAELDPELTILMFGIVEGLGVKWASLADPMGDLERGLLMRAGAAKQRGGRCVIVPPTPSDLGPEITAQVEATSKAAAAKAGCAYRPVLAGLWDPARAIADGLLLDDGFHPTPAGYRLLASRLVQAIASELPEPKARATKKKKKKKKHRLRA